MYNKLIDTKLLAQFINFEVNMVIISIQAVVKLRQKNLNQHVFDLCKQILCNELSFLELMIHGVLVFKTTW